MKKEEVKKIRKVLRKKKPNFVRQDYNKKSSLGDTWRRPRGVHSKMRIRHKSKHKRVGIGYGFPRYVKDLNRDGYKEVTVRTLKDLEFVDKEKQIAVLASSLGLKKRKMLLDKAKTLGVKVLNLTHDKIEKLLKDKAKKKEDKKKAKEEKKAKETPKKKAKEEKKSEEETKKPESEPKKKKEVKEKKEKPKEKKEKKKPEKKESKK